MVFGRTANGPAGLGDPDRFATGDGRGVVVSIEEHLLAILNAVGLRVLEIGVRIHPDEIGSGNDSVVGTIDPGSPCVDMAHGDPAQSSPCNGISHLGDVVRDGLGVGPNTGFARDANRGASVEIFTADRDPNHRASKVRAS